MKTLRLMGITLAVAALCLGYSSCGDDDEIEPETQVEGSTDEDSTNGETSDVDEISYTGTYDCKVDGIYYTLDFEARTAEVVGSGRRGMDIPSSIYYEDSKDSSRSGSYTVTSIFLFDNSDITSVTIPESVTSIRDHAFCECTSLTSVTIPNSVTSMGWKAFYCCSSLTEVTIPNSVTSIEYQTFSGCDSLTSITIPNSVTSIGGYAFYNCSGLTEVTIGNSVTSIGSFAFEDCRALASVTIGESVTSIASYAFSGCTSLTSVTIPNSVTSIGYVAFGNCTSLTSVTIGNSVTSIEGNAFNGCRSLTSVTIPESVTSIGSHAFGYCRGLTSVTSLKETPPSCSSDTFDGVDMSVCTLLVPVGSKDKYASATGWRSFQMIKEGTTEQL